MQQRMGLNKGVSITRQFGSPPQPIEPTINLRLLRRDGALFHAGILEEFEDTVIFQDGYTASGGALATGRYRR